jgi:uracil-DNA glycosylase
MQRVIRFSNRPQFRPSTMPALTSRPAEAIRGCSELLEKAIGLFPNLKVLMLMGDVAIKAINSVHA